MSIEDELLQLAREREAATESALVEMRLESPDRARRKLRAYLFRQVDRGRIRPTDERIPQLERIWGGLNELACPELKFSSGGRLEFNIRLEEDQRGWLVKQFQFHLHLPQRRRMDMVRIHLNAEASYNPLGVPRCHLQIGNSQAHVPFPVMDPRLILYLICEHIEPDFGAQTVGG